MTEDTSNQSFIVTKVFIVYEGNDNDEDIRVCCNVHNVFHNFERPERDSILFIHNYANYSHLWLLSCFKNIISCINSMTFDPIFFFFSFHLSQDQKMIN